MEQLCFDEVEAWVELIESVRKNKESNQRFAPTESALAILASLPDETWEDGKTFIDAEFGIGQLLVPLAIIKRELGHKEILSCIHGTEIVEKNTEICRQRLLDICGNTKANTKLVEKNILCRNSLKYDFEFNEK